MGDALAVRAAFGKALATGEAVALGEALGDGETLAPGEVVVVVVGVLPVLWVCAGSGVAVTPRITNAAPIVRLVFMYC